jgi:AraC family transcriptional regulator
MADLPRTLGFGETFDMAAAQTAGGQLLTLTAHRRHDEHPPHRHVNDYACIVLAGGFAELQGARWHERSKGAFFVHEAGEAHHDRIGSHGAMCLNLHFGPDDPRPPSFEGRCSTTTQIAAGRLAFELAARSRDELVMAALAAEIMGQIQPIESLADGGGWIDRVVEAISDEPARRWSLGELAAIAGRHPVHVAQAFRARSGLSLGAFQRLRRLTSLSLALRRGETPLAILAAEYGYCDQSHMTSEFRTAFGTSPGRYRRDVH